MKWGKKSFICLILLAISCISYLFFTGQYNFEQNDPNFTIHVNLSRILFKTDSKFLSVALDTSFMKSRFYELNDSDWKKLVEFSNLLSPAYLRLGGTDADRVIFVPDACKINDKQQNDKCNNSSTENSLIISGNDWVKINEFAKKSKLDFIFDVNVLLRSESEWDSSNAKVLLNFSTQNNLSLDFQLGNEPDSFKHVFNISISGAQLAKDFSKFKSILNSFELYKKSKLIGPDITRPKKLGRPSLEYLKEFLSNTISVDVVSWHHYYLNGRTANLNDFINPEVFNTLPTQINAIKKTVHKISRNLPIWISETSSAYGSGAFGLSDRFVASFLWLDKLGIAAQLGMSIVIRQSLLGGNYALIDKELKPSPDFWISYFYKSLVGRQVFDVLYLDKKQNKSDQLRFYCHCLLSNSTVDGNVVVFGLNLSNETQNIIVSGLTINYPIYSFTFSPEFGNLTSKSVLLNGRKLMYDIKNVHELLDNPEKVKFPLILPGYSIVFWIFKNLTEDINCN